jgi:uncharacterized protein (TIGR02147 family)
MNVFHEDDYRKSLKTRQKELQKLRPSLTWKKLAGEIPIQYTYLSKALNDEKTHLSEDHLYVICRALEFFPNELEFICLQRSFATSQDAERKRFLLRKILEARASQELNVEKQNLTPKKFNEQMRYLFEPLCLVVHQALEIEFFRKDPRRLCGPLNLTTGQLKETLRILSRNEYIDLEDDGLHVRKVKEGNIHFGPEHFLMRYHQSILKSQVNARQAQTPDKEKYSFMVTFTLDEPSYEKIRDEFKSFLKTVEKIARSSKTEHVYQLCFDLFKWL